jgi:pimeloyl-ACP methyl ester carboxylesterase
MRIFSTLDLRLAINTTKAKSTWPKSTCPTLFLLGQKDQMTPVKAAQSLIQLAQNGQVAYVNAGHQLMVEAPEETLKAMVAFCKK